MNSFSERSVPKGSEYHSIILAFYCTVNSGKQAVRLNICYKAVTEGVCAGSLKTQYLKNRFNHSTIYHSNGANLNIARLGRMDNLTNVVDHTL